MHASVRRTDETADDGSVRRQMVETIRRHGVRSDQILDAMARIPRHLHIPAEYRDRADPYGDHPCPIGFNQTISQPFIVAHMTELLQVTPGQKILEIGTGSGYQAAVLAELGAEVWTVERIPELAGFARGILDREGYSRVVVVTGDGYRGVPEQAPFDAVMVTCAPREVPHALMVQLRDGGRMVVPVGECFQEIIVLRKVGAGRIDQERGLAVRFVPMVRSDEEVVS